MTYIHERRLCDVDDVEGLEKDVSHDVVVLYLRPPGQLALGLKSRFDD